MPLPGAKPKTEVTDLNFDVLVEIMKHMSIRDVWRFIDAHKKFRDVWKTHKVHILLTILKASPEFEILLYLKTASRQELRTSTQLKRRMLYPRKIDFELDSERNEDGQHKTLMHLVRTPVTWEGGRFICPKKETLNWHSLSAVVEFASVIEWWVEQWPRFQWRGKANVRDRRSLTPEEQGRLRCALARWWLYSFYFHESGWRNIATPKKYCDDDRLHHFRICTTEELCELKDVWSTVYTLISKELCSSLMATPNRPRVDLCIWGRSRARHGNVVRTYQKLNPGLLKWLFMNYYRTDKDVIIAKVTSKCPRFTFDVETLSYALNAVLEEKMEIRAVRDPKLDPESMPPMGIVRDESRDAEVVQFRDDKWTSGLPPAHEDVLLEATYQPSSRIPHGVDGSEGY